MSSYLSEMIPTHAIAQAWEVGEMWFLGEARYFSAALHDLNPVFGFFDATLRGVGQVVFMNSPFAGIWITLGLMMADSYAAGLALFGACTATAVGMLIEWNAGLHSQRVRDGLYGFNGHLVGMAMGVFSSRGRDLTSAWLGPPLATAFLAALSAVICVALSKFLRQWQLPYLTLPFNLAVILFFGGVQFYDNWHYASSWEAHVPALPRPDIVICLQAQKYPIHHECVQPFLRGVFGALFQSFSEVFIVSNIAGGVLIFLGMFLCSPRASLFAFLGASASLATSSLVLGVDGHEAWLGLWGYNSVLTCIAVGGGVFCKPTWRSNVMAIFAACATTMLHGCLRSMMAVAVGLFQ